MDTWRVLIPMGWAVVSAAIGLLLYSRSEARFDNKTYVFAGAAAIAGGAFILLAKLTPAELVTGRGQDELSVSVSRLSAIRDANENLNSAHKELRVCASRAGPSVCGDELQSLQARMQQLDIAIRAINQ